MTAIADSGFVIALENTRDRHHISCVNLVQREQQIYLPKSVLNEVCFLLTKRGGN